MLLTHISRLCSRTRDSFRRLSTFKKPNGRPPGAAEKVKPQLNDENVLANAVRKDILLFTFEKPRFYQFVNIFALSQFIFWFGMSYAGLNLLDIPVEAEVAEKVKSGNADDIPFWRKMNLGEDKFRYGIVFGSILMGFGIMSVSWMYILRTIRMLVLRKDGKTVAVVTYVPFGKQRIIDAPLNNISADGSRMSGASQIAIRVKGHRFFFLLDLKGYFPHPLLFDQTVGTQRKLTFPTAKYSKY